jgi:hypothetical protein
VPRHSLNFLDNIRLDIFDEITLVILHKGFVSWAFETFLLPPFLLQIGVLVNLAIVSANNHYAGFGPGTANIFKKIALYIFLAKSVSCKVLFYKMYQRRCLNKEDDYSLIGID